MRKLRLVVIAIALMTIASTPAHAFFIFQHVVDPDQELRRYGGEVLETIANLYSRVSVLERGDSFDGTVEFQDLGERLQNVVWDLDAYVENIDGDTDVRIERLRGTHEDVYEKVGLIFSDRSYAYQLLSRHDLSLTLPETERQVFVQASTVIRILAETISETNLRSDGADITDVIKFLKLNETVLVLLDVLSLHSILLSTTR